LSCRDPRRVSANDRGTRVVNYAQWRSAEAFEAMVQNSTAQQHMALCAELANGYEPHLYTVESVHIATA
jgi:hypothetical protein